MNPLFKFELIDQEKAWRDILTDFSTTRKFYNSFYLDKKPSCKMLWVNNQLRLFDFGDDRFFNMNVRDAYMLRYSLTKSEAEKKLLGYKGKSISKSRGFGSKFQPKKSKMKSDYFEAFERGWEHYDEVFWSKYNFKRKDLEPDLKPCWYFSFYSPKFGGNVRIYSSKDDPIYMWTFPSGRQKIYAPKSEFHKWMGNASNEDVYFYTKGSDTFVLASGSKDAKTLFKHTEFDTGALQGEKRLPPDHFLVTLKRYNKIFISLDGDKDGLIWNQKIFDYLNSLGYPVSIVTCPVVKKRKDWSEHLEFAVELGSEDVFRKFLEKRFS